MPKKISDINHRPPPPPPPPTVEENILNHLRAHPDEGFQLHELATALGMLPRFESWAEVGGFALGALLVRASGTASKGPPAITRLEKVLEELREKGVIDGGADVYGNMHYWFPQEQK